ncbi:hypothetical protein LJE71_15090 [Xanthobacter autotrophicus]|uniref:hypothetical protein n=1 Tax=Xanthobacter autotrophicus TaxID=280 RepID=UPI001E355F74|nr:hypothetical protein [Xanthobacter autotrophicus]UDQ87622.1 hypothetical protein LJE71_15090 [Xanthobacter autotrophicus]
MDRASLVLDPVVVLLDEMNRLDAVSAAENYAEGRKSDVLYTALVMAECGEVPTTAEGVHRKITMHLADADCADTSDGFARCFRPNTPDFVKRAARDAWRDLELIAASAANGRLGAEDVARADTLVETIDCLAQPFFAEAVHAMAAGVRAIVGEKALSA